jgi:L-idonate 5-dehydrogenase
MVREINFVGSMRYGDVFDEAIRLVAAGRIDVRPLISDVLPIADCARAMALAADKANALKVQVQI